MSLLASVGIAQNPAGWMRPEVLIYAAFAVYAVGSFLCVSRYAFAEHRAGRMLNGPSAPMRLGISTGGGVVYGVSVLAFFFAQSIFVYLVVVFGVMLVLIESHRTAVQQFGLDRLSTGQVIGWSLLICGALNVVEMPLSLLVDRGMTAIHLAHPEQVSVETFRQLSKPAEMFSFLTMAILIAPLMEELFFRGFLFTFLKNYTSTTLALFLSAGVFAFAHANLGSVFELWVLGLVLGLAYEHTGSLLLPIGIHACWNFLTAMSLLLERSFS